MKRKRKSDQIDDHQTCDLILTDANGRSIRVHKALLVDKSDYFARLLSENSLNELQLDENYLIELLHYLYNHESEDRQRANLQHSNHHQLDEDDSNSASFDFSVGNDDIVILMQLLALSRKYSFRQLHQNLMNEINYKLRPSTVLVIYNTAIELGIDELKNEARLMILTWLPVLQKTEAFFNLDEKSIYDIFSIERPDIDNECKLNALSVWWSHNKESDITNLWVKLSTCNNNNN